jgi:molybdopterin molybdotransferase
MIRLEEALDLILGSIVSTNETTFLPLANSLGQVLAVDVFSDTDIPQFDKSAMDGFACRRAELEQPLEILETIQTGFKPAFEIHKGQCSKIMTGSMVPKGADCVVMQEFTEINQGGKMVFTGKDTATNILYQGQDVKKGERTLEKGSLISPQNVAILASAGLEKVEVFRKSRVAIISTGSELVEPGEPVRGAKIRNTNTSQLIGQVTACNQVPVYFGLVPDEKEAIKKAIRKAEQECEVIILTGGASVGEFDLVPKVVENLGYNRKFQKVAIQPGKPVSFSVKEEKYCFGLSGNPVSSFLQFQLLVKPMLVKLSGSRAKTERIRINFDGEFRRKKAERKYFLPVILNGKGFVEPPVYHGSAHLHALNGIYGFAEVAEGVYEIKKGEEVYVRPL